MADHSSIEDPETEVDLSPYAGRWVALAAGQVAGVGDTASAAENLGRRNRFREKLTVYYVEPPGGDLLPLPPLMKRLLPIFAWQEVPIYLVGGAVRDALLGISTHDLDFVVPQSAIKLAFRVGNALREPAFALDRDRDTGRVVLAEARTTLDFARLRGENLEADLRDRDFTINAMAFPVAARRRSSLIDPCNGQADLAQGLLRQTHDSSVADDPIRALRAVRLALQFDLSMTPETITAVADAASRLSLVSIERVRDELLKLMQLPAPHDALQYLAEFGLLKSVLPAIARLEYLDQTAPHRETVLEHTLSVLRWLVAIQAAIVETQPTIEPAVGEAMETLSEFVPQLMAHLNRQVKGGLDGWLLLRLGALFHDVGKSETQSIEPSGRIRFLGHDGVGAALTGRLLRHLRLSNEAIGHVKAIVAGHMRPLYLADSPAASRRAIYRFFRAYDHAGLDIGLLALADHLAIHEGVGDPERWNRLQAVVRQLFRHYFQRFDETVKPTPLLDGQELMDALELEPGPEIGRLLRLIVEAQAAGEIRTREEAIDFAAKVYTGG